MLRKYNFIAASRETIKLFPLLAFEHEIIEAYYRTQIFFLLVLKGVYIWIASKSKWADTRISNIPPYVVNQ